MSRLVDERIVEMSFDNKSFEKNVKTSMDTVDDLKSSLDFSGVSSSIEKNLNSIDTSLLAEGLGSVSKGFTAMEVVAIAAIANITNKVVDLGLNLVKSLTVDNIASGWSQFSEASVNEATLLAQGHAAEEVTETMDLLRWYTDETSHNFTSMMKNLGSFTGAGMKLDESVTAMMGIANWASLSGKNASDASHAMERLSVALGQGSIKLRNWQSIQTLGMDTAEFKEMVLKEAERQGQLIQAMDESYITMSGKTFQGVQDFQTLLSEGWFTSDVLMAVLEEYGKGAMDIYEIMKDDSSLETASEALKKYGSNLTDLQLRAFLAAQEARTFGDAIQATKDAVTSGWGAIFTNIFGQVEEAKVLWTDLANELWYVFAGGLAFKNEILSVWGSLGGRNDLFENTEESTGAFWNLFYAIVELKDLISTAWNIIFPISAFEEEGEIINDVGTRLKKFTEKLKEMTKSLRLNESQGQVVINVFKGIFSILKVGLNVIKGIWIAINPLIKAAGDLAKSLFGLLGGFGDGVSKATEGSNVFIKMGEKVASVLTVIINEIKSFHILSGIIKMVKIFVEAFKSGRKETEGFGGVLGIFNKIMDSLLKLFLTISNVLKKHVTPHLSSLFITLAKFSGSLVAKAFDGFAWLIDTTANMIELIATSKFLANVLKTLKKTFDSVTTAIKNFFGGFKKKKKDEEGFDGDISLLKWQTQELGEVGEVAIKTLTPLQKFMQGLSDLFSGIWSVIKNTVSVLTNILSYIGNLLKKFADTIGKIFKGESKINWKEIFSVAFLAGLAVSIIKVINMFKGITNAFEEVFLSMAKSIRADAIVKYAEALKTMSIAILIMVAALILISAIDDDKLIKSMAVLTAMLGLFVGVIAILMKIMTAGQTMSMTFSKFQLGLQALVTARAISVVAGAMVSMATAMVLVSVAMKIIATMSVKDIMKGLGTIAVIMGMFITVGLIVTKFKVTMYRALTGLLSMALAINALILPIKILGSMDMKKLTQGILSIAIIMSMFSSIMKSARNVTNSMGFGIAIALIANAILIASMPIVYLGLLPWKIMMKGLVGVALIVNTFIVFGRMQSKMQESLKAATSLVLVALALNLMILPIAAIGFMSWGMITKGIAAMYGVVGSIVLLGYFQKYLTDSMKSAATLSLIAIALNLVMTPMMALGQMGWKKLAVALVAIYSFVMSIVFLGKMNNEISKTLTTIALLVSFAIALNLITGPLMLLGAAFPVTMLGILAASLILWNIIALAKVVGGKSGLKIEKAATAILLMAGFVITLRMLITPLILLGISFPLVMLGLVAAALILGTLIILLKTISSKSGLKIPKAISAVLLMVGFVLLLTLIATPLGLMGMSFPFVALGLLASKFMIDGLIKLMDAISKKTGLKIQKTLAVVTLMIGIAVALTLLAVPLLFLGALGWSKLAIGVLGMIAIAGSLAVLGYLGSKIEKSTKTATSMVIISAALILAAIPFIALGMLGWPTIIKGIVGITTIASSMFILGMMAGKLNNPMKVASALMLISGSLILATIPFLYLGELEWFKMKRGLLGMFVATGLLIALGFVANKLKEPLKAALTLTALGAALLIATIPFIFLGKLKWSEILKGAVALTVIGLILAGLGALFGSAKVLSVGLLLFAISLAAMSLSFIVFAKAMNALMDVDFKRFTKQLGGFAVAMLALIGMAALFAILSPILIVAAAGMILFGLGLYITAESMRLFILMLGIFNVELLEKLKGSVAVLREAAPLIIEAMGLILNIIFETMRAAIVEFFTTLGVLAEQIMLFLYTYGPGLISVLFDLITMIFQKIEEEFPEWARIFVNLFVMLFEAVRDRIADIVNILIDILIAIMDTIATRAEELITSLANMLCALMDAFGKNISKVLQSVIDLVVNILKGLANAFSIGNVKKIHDALLELLKSIFFSMGYVLGRLGPDIAILGLQIIMGLVKGIVDGVGALINAVVNAVKDAFNAVKKFLGIKSPSRLFAEVGYNMAQGLSVGMDDNSDSVSSSATNLAEGAIEGLEKSGIAEAIRKINEGIDEDLQEELVIRPVMDLTEIQNGTNKILGFMGDVDGYSISGSNDVAFKTSDSINSDRKERISSRPDKSSDLNKVGEQQPVFNNTFNISGAASPKEIAKEVTEIMQTQINRSRAAYGKSGI